MTEREEIEQTVSELVNPVLAMHGGFCQVEAYADGLLTVSLRGGCAGCPSSQISLLMSVEPLIKEALPFVTDVVSAAD